MQHREELVSLRARAQGLPRRLIYYARVPRLLADLELAHGDGHFARLLRTSTARSQQRANSEMIKRFLVSRLSVCSQPLVSPGHIIIAATLPADSYQSEVGREPGGDRGNAGRIVCSEMMRSR